MPDIALDPTGGMPQATDGDLETILHRSRTEPVLLYFTTPWCGPCQVFGPLLDRFHADRAETAMWKVDCDESVEVARHFAVDAYPTVAVVRHGISQWSQAGALPADEIAPTLDTVLAAARTAVAGGFSDQRRFEYPLTVTFPDLGDHSTMIEIVRPSAADDHGDNSELVRPGCAVVLCEQDALRVSIHGDDRQPFSLDMSYLSSFPAALYGSVSVQARALPAAQLAELGTLRTIRSLTLRADEPLDEAALDAVASLSLISLGVQLPAFDADLMRRRMPGVQINGSALSAAMVEALPAWITRTSQRASDPEWTTPDDLRKLISAGGPVLAMVQAEHPAFVEVAAGWHDLRATGALAGAYTVSAYRDPLCDTLGLAAFRAAIVLFDEGLLRRRMDLPFDPAVLATIDLDDFVNRGFQHAHAHHAHPGQLGRRTIRLAADADPGPSSGDVRIELVPPRQAQPGAAFSLTADRDEVVPPGWRVRTMHIVRDQSPLPLAAWRSALVQELALYVYVEDDVDLTGLCNLPALEALTLLMRELPESVLTELLPRLTGLRSLRVPTASPEQVAALHANLPDVVINGNWPIPWSSYDAGLTTMETVTDQEVDLALDQAGDEPVLLYFTTSWCGPCRTFGPDLDAFAGAHPDLLRVLRIDAERSAMTADRFRVHAYPTLTLLYRGEQLWLRAGALTAEELERDLPQISAAARRIPSDRPAIEYVRPETALDRQETLAVQVPDINDPRVTVWHGRDKVASGERRQLDPGDGLRVSLVAAEDDLALDLGFLRDFAQGAVDSVNLHHSHVTADQLAELRHVASLAIVSSRPLSTEVVQTLPSLAHLQLLHLDAPGTDLDAIRRLVPQAMVNLTWIDPFLAEQIARHADSAEPDREQ